jgi:hypothetical protein
MSSLRRFELPSQVPSEAPWDCASFLSGSNLGIVDANEMHWMSKRFVEFCTLDCAQEKTVELLQSGVCSTVYSTVSHFKCPGLRQASPLELRSTDQKNGRCEIWWATYVRRDPSTRLNHCFCPLPWQFLSNTPQRSGDDERKLADLRSHNLDNFGLPLALGIFRGRIVHRQPRFLFRGFSNSLPPQWDEHVQKITNARVDNLIHNHNSLIL